MKGTGIFEIFWKSGLPVRPPTATPLTETSTAGGLNVWHLLEAFCMSEIYLKWLSFKNHKTPTRHTFIAEKISHILPHMFKCIYIDTYACIYLHALYVWSLNLIIICVPKGSNSSLRLNVWIFFPPDRRRPITDRRPLQLQLQPDFNQQL